MAVIKENEGQSSHLKKVKVKPVAKWTRREQENERKAPKKVELVTKQICKDEENEGTPPQKVKMVAELLQKDEAEKNEGKAPKKQVAFVLKRALKDEPEEDIPESLIQAQPPSPKRRKAANGLRVRSKAMSGPSPARMRANQVKASLSPQYPIMVKEMLKSHVSGGFWLGLESAFCDKYLPKEDTWMTLEDELGKCSESKYLSEKTGLSAGWRRFSLAYNLSVGDVVVFHLVTPLRFKVYISRANKEDVEGDLNLLKLDANTKQTRSGNRGLAKKATEDSDSQLPSGSSSEETNSTDDANYKRSDSDHSVHDSDDCGFNLGDGIRGCKFNADSSSQETNSTDDATYKGSDVYHYVLDNVDRGFNLGDGIRGCEFRVDFSEVMSFAQFDILADGFVITPELSKDLQLKYYELCCSRNCFLHQNLVCGLNIKTIAGIIADTVNIAHAIRDSKLTTSQDELANWKTILDGLQIWGMDVGFLISHLDQLITLIDKSNRLEEARAERSRALEEIKRLEIRTLEVKERVRRLDEETMTLEAGGPKLESMYLELAKTSC